MESSFPLLIDDPTRHSSQGDPDVSPLEKNEPRPPESPSRPVGVGRFVRWGVNLWLVSHLAAIVVAPAVSPSSPLIQSVWNVFHSYLELLYLNNGYHFFAPEPGNSTLISYAAERPDGTVVRGRIPDPQTVPRLLYHRYFMLTEHTSDAPEELKQEWLESYAECIGQKYGATQVSLTGQIHVLPTMEMVRNGVRLDDPSSYQDEPLGVFQCGAH
jgi:hypothetical protein